jgi:hypothetical protein
MRHRAAIFHNRRYASFNCRRRSNVSARGRRESGTRFIPALDDVFTHLFGIAEQYHRVVAVEELIVDAGVPRSTSGIGMP